MLLHHSCYCVRQCSYGGEDFRLASANLFFPCGVSFIFAFAVVTVVYFDDDVHYYYHIVTCTCVRRSSPRVDNFGSMLNCLGLPFFSILCYINCVNLATIYILPCFFITVFFIFLQSLLRLLFSLRNSAHCRSEFKDKEAEKQPHS